VCVCVCVCVCTVCVCMRAMCVCVCVPMLETEVPQQSIFAAHRETRESMWLLVGKFSAMISEAQMGSLARTCTVRGKKSRRQAGVGT
jgi:hypothetical protein